MEAFPVISLAHVSYQVSSSGTHPIRDSGNVPWGWHSAEKGSPMQELARDVLITTPHLRLRQSTKEAKINVFPMESDYGKKE